MVCQAGIPNGVKYVMRQPPGMDIQQIITDTTMSPEAKVIPVTAEIERQLRGYQEIEIALICEDVIFHRSHAPFIPRANELISCRLAVRKEHFATLWNVTQVEHGIGIDRLLLACKRLIHKQRCAGNTIHAGTQSEERDDE